MPARYTFPISRMLSIENSLLAMAVLFDATLAVFILRGNWKRPVNALFGLFLIGLALWGSALIGYGLSATAELAIGFGKAAYAAALLVGASFYLFSLAFPDNVWPGRRSLVAAIALIAAYSASLTLRSFLIAGIIVAPNGNRVTLYPFDYFCFAAIFGCLFLGGLIRLWRKWSQAREPQRMQLLAIALSVTVAGIGGMYFNLVLASPFVADFSYLWTGPLFTTVIAVAIMYAVFRFRLFSAKVLAAELLIALLWIFTLLRTLLAGDSRERILDGGLFALSVVIGSLLVKSVRDEVRARESLSEFMSFAAHELRNPITVMRGLAANVLESDAGEGSADVRDAVGKIKAEGDIVLALIAQFLDKSKLELGQVAYDLRAVDVAGIVAGIADGLRARAQEKGLQLRLHIESPNVTARGDEAKLQEVIGNLVDNAIKYTRAGHVDLSVAKFGRTVRITVSDTGVGIPANTLKHLFQKFSRADAQRMNLLGSGLGLYLSKAFVEGMGGRIRAESEGAERGSRFIVELPEA